MADFTWTNARLLLYICSVLTYGSVCLASWIWGCCTSWPSGGWSPLCTWREALLHFVKQSELLAGSCNSHPCGGSPPSEGLGALGAECVYQVTLVLAIFVVLGEMHWCLWNCAYRAHTLGFTHHPCYQVSSGAARKQGCVLLACL